MRILIATDAWHPQVNGVVRTLAALVDELRRRGIEVMILSPADFRTVRCPTYPEIRLALATGARIETLLREFDPQALHIATEGPIGLQLRQVALRLGLPFTTSFHTRFPEYLRRRVPVPESLTYAWLRRFHAPAAACLVPTEDVRTDLAQRGFRNLMTWTRGVDPTLFRPLPKLDLGLKGPVFMTVSRIAPEKGVETFLDLDLPGSKLVVGAGPSLPALRRRYPEVCFVGSQSGEMLTRHYASGDVFVFPSRTDTFGVVLLEALACGLPVAAFPEPGPLAVLAGSEAGVVSDDLRLACLAALGVSREAALTRSQDFTWSACADVFLSTLAPYGKVAAERMSWAA
ncbi:glycosyltransferase family 4 protein [Mangrovicella endophytica]|uniref:glycosyltransferase family 4 protein n=1 Tax=Mangrovicella endophytica TaxID=2066697 RepID=UPI001FE1383E|nr:glycosyltransferase family 1 protein [Mangrovicella endophytica]